jgi:predicted alpha/beta hydrolase
VGHAPEKIIVRRFAAERPWAQLVLAGAMGVRQDFYEPFARYLAANGITVATFDYRGMGYSRPASLRGFEADVSMWAEQDLDVDALNGFYRNARIDRHHVDPAVLGEPKRIGHFGFFHPRSETTFWAQSLGWLRERAETA